VFNLVWDDIGESLCLVFRSDCKVFDCISSTIGVLSLRWVRFVFSSRGCFNESVSISRK
jgi:hypothetical protein